MLHAPRRCACLFCESPTSIAEPTACPCLTERSPLIEIEAALCETTIVLFNQIVAVFFPSQC